MPRFLLDPSSQIPAPRSQIPDPRSHALQDLDYDAAVPMYIMRPYIIEYLHSRVFAAGHKNILEDYLYQAFITKEYVAMTRANAAIDLLLVRPLRWLAGKSSELVDWSPYSMGPVLETVEALLEKGAQDGRVLLDPAIYDPASPRFLFKSLVDTQPAFKDYLEHTYQKDHVLSPAKTKKHLQFKLALNELLSPSDASNGAATDLTIEYLMVQCRAGLGKLHDTRTVLPKYTCPRRMASSPGRRCSRVMRTLRAATPPTTHSPSRCLASSTGC